MDILKTTGSFLIFLGREFLKPVTYATAVFIGLIINTLTSGNALSSLVPFAVSLLVQMFSKAGVKFRARFKDYLLLLPGERQDPAFVADEGGRIIASTGNTAVFLEENKMESIGDLFPGIDLVHHFKLAGDDAEAVSSMELYSLPLVKWYQVKFKCRRNMNMILVWLEDITRRKVQEENLLSLRQFSSETTSVITELVKTRDTFERVAYFILKQEWEAVFIARESGTEILSGQVFRLDGESLRKSSRITIPMASGSPVWESHLSRRVSWAVKTSSQRQEDFEAAHHFNDEVREFIARPIVNYINYHEGDLSLIAFNKKSGITSFEETVMETLVNTARSITYLTDLAIENDERFVQSIQGLCSAAEYSDEQTGRHILRVNEYSRLTAARLGCPSDFQDAIGEVAAIHDIGKVAMPEIIKLPRVLTPEERMKIELHTVYGASILKQMIDLSTIPDPRMVMARAIALHHHQCWNGSGYPALLTTDGTEVDLSDKTFPRETGLRTLAGDEIPLEALIVSLADNYDALRSARHYKPEFSHEKAVSIISKDDRTAASGEQRFGPELHRIFMDNADEFDRIYTSMR